MQDLKITNAWRAFLLLTVCTFNAFEKKEQGSVLSSVVEATPYI